MRLKRRTFKVIWKVLCVFHYFEQRSALPLLLAGTILPPWEASLRVKPPQRRAELRESLQKGARAYSISLLPVMWVHTFYLGLFVLAFIMWGTTRVQGFLVESSKYLECLEFHLSRAYPGSATLLSWCKWLITRYGFVACEGASRSLDWQDGTHSYLFGLRKGKWVAVLLG